MDIVFIIIFILGFAILVIPPYYAVTSELKRQAKKETFRIIKKSGHYRAQERHTILFIGIWMSFLDGIWDMPIEFKTQEEARKFIDDVKAFRANAGEDCVVKTETK